MFSASQTRGIGFPGVTSMCGICGFTIGSLDQERAGRVLTQMRDSLAHRGPDDADNFFDEEVFLGHRRLSIIDLPGGRQPIRNEDGTVWVIFNGEIYNYRELREDLERAGHSFYTKSDTETIVHLYEERGDDLVAGLNGMFAFVIWDRNRKSLLLARDRLGVKPLHYTLAGGSLIFASEIKAILCHPAVRRDLDLESLSKYLTFEYVPAPHTIFKGVKKVEPGHTIRYDLQEQRLVERKYWDVPLIDDSIGYKGEEEYREELLQRLKESVKRRLVSDVPIGILLSGGIDSSTVAALAAQAADTPVRCFSITFDDSSFDESAYAKKAAAFIGAELHTMRFSNQAMADILPGIQDVLDEPLADGSILPTYLLSRFVRDHVKVALGGDGGDELFAGYPLYQALKLIRYYNVFPTEIRALLKKLARKLPVSYGDVSLDFRIKQFLRGAGVSTEVMFFLWLGSFLETEKNQLFTEDSRRQLGRHNPFEDVIDHIRDSNLKNDLERTLYLAMKLYLQDCILVKVDRASMANSLEVRSPFLDYTVVEFVAQLPMIYKLRRLTTKYLLKKAVTGLIPKDIIHRKKKGFGAPIGMWIHQELRELFETYLAQDRIKKGGLFRPEYVSGLLREHLDRRRDNRKLLWTLLVFELWRERWMP